MVHLLTRKAPNTLTDHHLRIHWQKYCSLAPALEQWLNGLLCVDSQQRIPSAKKARQLLQQARNTPEVPQAVLFKLEPVHTGIHPSPIEEDSEEETPNTPPVQPSSVSPLASPMESTPVVMSDPLLQGLPQHRRGWWKVRPPSPPEVRSRPTHPATQLVFMSAGMFFVAVTLQLLLVAVL